MALLALFAFQVLTAHAQDAGLIICVSHNAQKGSASGTTSDPMTASYHCHCPQAGDIAMSQIGSISIFSHGSYRFLHGDETCPDGPVRAIDYPPQLS